MGVAEVAALPVQAEQRAMKDVSTCRSDPRRVWEWCELAVEMAEEYA